MRLETTLIHRTGTGLTPALDRSTTFRHGGELEYARTSHPVGSEAEQLLGALDGGEALLYASGLAAVTAVVLGLLEPGDTVAVPHDGYFGTEKLLATELARWGVKHVSFDQTGPLPAGVRLAFLEAPSNPMLSVPDIAATCAAARAQGTLVAVDATVATPVLLRPLEHGADIVVHSATKALAGHSDVLAGVTVCRDAAHAQRLRSFRTLTGSVAGADAAWLLLRGLQTLAIRVERSSQTAAVLAARLAAHPKVAVVRHPGFGALLSFDVAGDAGAAGRVEAATRLIANATSLGGVHSTMESRHRHEGDRVPVGLLRLSVGLEHVDDLWEDLEQALERA